MCRRTVQTFEYNVAALSRFLEALRVFSPRTSQKPASKPSKVCLQSGEGKHRMGRFCGIFRQAAVFFHLLTTYLKDTSKAFFKTQPCSLAPPHFLCSNSKGAEGENVQRQDTGDRWSQRR